MTSDAKVGLLLGLVFIFIIAFIINGLPSFRDKQNNNELTTNMARSSDRSHGIGNHARKATREVITPIEPVLKRTDTALRAETQGQGATPQEVRFRADLPKSSEAVKVSKEVITASTDTLVNPVEPKPPRQVRTRRTVLKKVYTVKEGDSLALIAKKYYGDEEGNRRANIARIFEANRKILKSADEIYVGQKIIIPPLSTSGQKKEEVAAALSTDEFEEVESVGRRHRPTENIKSKRHRYYIVKEGDSLWQIAYERLGNGNRYREVAKLNAAVLEDEDYLAVGMRLKLPAR